MCVQFVLPIFASLCQKIGMSRIHWHIEKWKFTSAEFTSIFGKPFVEGIFAKNNSCSALLVSAAEEITDFKSVSRNEQKNRGLFIQAPCRLWVCDGTKAINFAPSHSRSLLTLDSSCLMKHCVLHSIQNYYTLNNQTWHIVTSDQGSQISMPIPIPGFSELSIPQFNTWFSCQIQEIFAWILLKRGVFRGITFKIFHNLHLQKNNPAICDSERKFFVLTAYEHPWIFEKSLQYREKKFQYRFNTWFLLQYLYQYSTLGFQYQY